MKPCSTPCQQCPFARSTSKAYLDTRGQNGERFAGQAIGPFSLPCHMTRKFNEWHSDPTNQTPCVGAAIYRSNCRYSHLSPAIPRLPEDKETVFASPDELLAHHTGSTIDEATSLLKTKTVFHMLREEMLNRNAVIFKQPY